MVTTYRALRGISIPKSESALKRMQTGKPRADDWVDVKVGGTCRPPASLIESYLAEKLIKEVTSGG